MQNPPNIQIKNTQSENVRDQGIRELEDYFKKLGDRPQKSSYFCRLQGIDRRAEDFLLQYYRQARKTGAVFQERIPNPTPQNLAYLQEILGSDFRAEEIFLTEKLGKWLPRLGDLQREVVARGIAKVFLRMAEEGKTESMMKNAYMKFMCWLYYRLEQVVSRLGEETAPKILYEGEISAYELDMLSILFFAGCDILLICRNEEAYRKADPNSLHSQLFEKEGMLPLPEDLIDSLREKIAEREKDEKLLGPRPKYENCTNAWISGEGLADILTPPESRGEEEGFFYNCFCRISGVKDRLNYENELYRFELQIKQEQRNLLIFEEEIPPPTPEEIRAIHRKNYSSAEQMLTDLSGMIEYSGNIELQRLMVRAFLSVLLPESRKKEMNLSRMTAKAVYLLCWLKRCLPKLFPHWQMPQIPVLIYLGGCKNESEVLFLRMLARLPLDILLLVPDRKGNCLLEDPLLYEIHYEESLALRRFPKESRGALIGTAAYHAERELDTVMYQDSGLYRSHQYEKATSVVLQTIYEEIGILWDQELKYRPSFAVVEERVSLPVIFAKVSGVKGSLQDYWSDIKKLITRDCLVISKPPFVDPAGQNPAKAHAAEFFRNGRLQRERIKAHSSYPYAFLREEVQESILDKIALLIENKAIKGIFETGIEYTVVSTLLNLDKKITRLMQRFDFTKKNPKLIYINTAEESISLEDSILTAFLSLYGFDLVFFVPTGYKSVERYFSEILFVEHQIGEYLYDLQVPNFEKVTVRQQGKSLRDILFGRGK